MLNRFFPQPVFIIFFLMTMIGGAIPACAAPAVMDDGRVLDISPEQVEKIKEYPAIYYFSYPPEDLVNSRVEGWEILKLSDGLGGGFVTGTSANLRNALIRADVFQELGQQNAALPLSPAAYAKKSMSRSMGNELSLGYGYRQDELDWNIAGNMQGANPNVLSELTWEDLIIHELRLGARMWFKKAFCIQGEFHYGTIVAGENQDSDYLEDDRENEFSRSNNDAGDGNTLDASIAVGYAFRFGTDFFSLTPLIGYSYHEQNLRMTDGDQTVTWDGGPPLGPFSGLDSSYETQWRGFWLGLEPRLGLRKISRHLRIFTIYAGYEHHWLNYSAVADWNLRSDFDHPKSFEHEADGQGDVFLCGILTELHKNWLLDIGYEQQKWSTDSGIDRVYLVTGTTLKTQLNEVNWESSVFKLEISFIF